MLRIREAIVVEGRYDKNTLSQLVDTVIIETSGFGIFKDKERLALLRRLAEKRGLIVLTDPDGAGFVIRGHLRGSLPPDRVKHAYVPDIYGKERRKRQGGKEGKLGVEGMRPEVLEAALRRAGATFLDEEGERAAPAGRPITKADFVALGLSGGPGAGRSGGPCSSGWSCPNTCPPTPCWRCSTPCLPARSWTVCCGARQADPSEKFPPKISKRA